MESMSDTALEGVVSPPLCVTMCPRLRLNAFDAACGNTKTKGDLERLSLDNQGCDFDLRYELRCRCIGCQQWINVCTLHLSVHLASITPPLRNQIRPWPEVVVLTNVFRHQAVHLM